MTKIQERGKIWRSIGCYHAIDTVLSMYGVAFKRHKDTLGHFNKNYVAAGLFPRETWGAGLLRQRR